jgi:hypothetical protein
MKRKPIDYYDCRIEKLKATIKRLIAEKRLAILYERENSIKMADKGGRNEK